MHVGCSGEVTSTILFDMRLLYIFYGLSSGQQVVWEQSGWKQVSAWAARSDAAGLNLETIFLRHAFCHPLQQRNRWQACICCAT